MLNGRQTNEKKERSEGIEANLDAIRLTSSTIIIRGYDSFESRFSVFPLQEKESLYDYQTHFFLICDESTDLNYLFII